MRAAVALLLIWSMSAADAATDAATVADTHAAAHVAAAASTPRPARTAHAAAAGRIDSAAQMHRELDTPPVDAIGDTAGDAANAAASLTPRIAALAAEAQAEVAVAYRRLDHADELFIRADDAFHAASTMKVPVMIDLFRQADAGTIRLDTPIPVVNQFSSIVDGSPYSLDATDDSDKGEIYNMIGKTMTPRALCEAMITVSSNLATNILIQTLGVTHIQQTVAALGAGGMQVRRGVEDSKAFAQGQNNTTTARGLQVLLEAIASGQAASPAASQEMIAILKRQQFNTGIPAGLPAAIAVAHKTGWITKIHHDAGIVYAPHPYILVVLVRGVPDEARSAKLIADVSRLIFTHAGGGSAADSVRP